MPSIWVLGGGGGSVVSPGCITSFELYMSTQSLICIEYNFSKINTMISDGFFQTSLVLLTVTLPVIDFLSHPQSRLPPPFHPFASSNPLSCSFVFYL